MFFVLSSQKTGNADGKNILDEIVWEAPRMFAAQSLFATGALCRGGGGAVSELGPVSSFIWLHYNIRSRNQTGNWGLRAGAQIIAKTFVKNEGN